MLPGIGWQELVIVLVVMLIIFGPKRLPELGRSLGKGLKEFKKSTSDLQEQLTLDEPAEVVKSEKQAEPAEQPAENTGHEGSDAAGKPVAAAEAKPSPEPGSVASEA